MHGRNWSNVIDKVWLERYQIVYYRRATTFVDDYQPYLNIIKKKGKITIYSPKYHQIAILSPK
jgi:hypothetical protein